jgi:hypothetical protein
MTAASVAVLWAGDRPAQELFLGSGVIIEYARVA